MSFEVLYFDGLAYFFEGDTVSSCFQTVIFDCSFSTIGHSGIDHTFLFLAPRAFGVWGFGLVGRSALLGWGLGSVCGVLGCFGRVSSGFLFAEQFQFGPVRTPLQ